MSGMLEYIAKVQRQLIDVHGFQEDPDRKGIPLNVPDGEYPMTIDGKLDTVRVVDGRISCCNHKPSLEELAEATRKLHSVLSDRHPGLATWTHALVRNGQELYDLLKQCVPKP